MFDVAKARSLVDQLRIAFTGWGTQIELYAASTHDWCFAKLLPAAQLAAWEHAHGVTLPDDYRDFLTRLGNGGAGPDHGIFALGTWDGGDLDPMLGGLARPFQLDTIGGPGTLPDGALWICHHGAGLRTLLVVTGPERGNVWFDGRANHRGITPHVDASGTHRSFGAWYIDWLEDALATVPR